MRHAHFDERSRESWLRASRRHGVDVLNLVDIGDVIERVRGVEQFRRYDGLDEHACCAGCLDVCREMVESLRCHVATSDCVDIRDRVDVGDVVERAGERQFEMVSDEDERVVRVRRRECVVLL